MPDTTEETVPDTEEQEGSEEESSLPAEGDETGSEGEEAEESAGEPGSEAPASEEADQEEEAETEMDLLSPEEVAALSSNPKALRKAYNRAYTQKMQMMHAASRMMEALQRDPQTTIRQIAAVAGLKIAEPETKQELDEIQAGLEEVLGPEVAAKLKPVFDKQIQAVVAKQVGPIKEAQTVQLRKAADERASQVLEQFQKEHPDWKKHEPKMLELARKIQATPEMTEAEYTETLYYLATRDLKSGDAAEEVVKRINKSASKTPAATRQAPPSRVATSTSRKMTIREALTAALHGEGPEE